MIPLKNKANTDYNNTAAPLSTYPYGNIRDDPGDNSGTAVNKVNHADFHQFFAKLMDMTSNPYRIFTKIQAGILQPSGPETGCAPANNLPDNATNGFQYIQALFVLIGTHVLNFIADQTTVNAGTDDMYYVTSLKLNTYLKKALSWVTISYGTNWSANTNDLQYAKNPLGEVWLRGQVQTTSGSLTLPSLIGTLPSGYRPAQEVFKTVSVFDNTSSTNTAGVISINTDGTINLIKVYTGFTNNDQLFVSALDHSFPTS
jgi:hypothetical protein